MQLLSQQLARRLAGSALAAEHIESSRPLLGAARKQSAFEDVWLGYALYSLVPSAQNITIVGIDRFSYYFDQTTRPMMTNSTILVHLAGDKDGRRIKHVYNFSQRQHCASNGALDCVPFKAPRCPQGPYGPHGRLPRPVFLPSRLTDPPVMSAGAHFWNMGFQ